MQQILDEHDKLVLYFAQNNFSHSTDRSTGLSEGMSITNPVLM
jgi:hypothetical protein